MWDYFILYFISRKKERKNCLRKNYIVLQITYSGAILEVCMRKLVFYPEIVGFIEEEKDRFPSVKVQYLFNSPPKLIMLDDAGQHKETIR